jgi:hypothetical protein
MDKVQKKTAFTEHVPIVGENKVLAQVCVGATDFAVS